METQSVMERMGTCISDVAGWMSSNRLQLNTAKTESAPHPERPVVSLRRQHQTRNVHP